MQYQKTLPVDQGYDVAVAGGGMSGVCAAIAAARQGCRTVLLEKGNCLGGVATQAGVCHLLGGKRFDSEKNAYVPNVKGIFEEIATRLIEAGAAVDPLTVDRNRNPHGCVAGLAEGVPFDIERMKILLETLCLDAGVTLRYGVSVVDAIAENGYLRQLVTFDQGGLRALPCKMAVDATGDAALVHMLGCPTILGRDEDHLMTPTTLEMHVEHVDREALMDFWYGQNEPRCRELIKRLRAEGIWNFAYEVFIAVQLNDPDVFMVNTMRQVGINGVDNASMTRALVEGRKENHALFEVMKQHIPGFANARIKRLADGIGVRETRRIVGRLMLTVDDLVEGRRFDDTVAVSSYGWDLPDPKRPSVQPMTEKKVAVANPYKAIPYRCLLPQGIENVCVAGRCLSVERDVLGPLRVMAPCCAMGQAVGIACGLALEADIDLPQVDAGKLRQEIIRRGGVVEMDREGNALA